MEKKAQFYFLATIILAFLFINFLTLSNKANYDSQTKLLYENDELETEISFLMDYFSHGQISDSVANETLVNFSKFYIEKIGTNKDVFFIFGKSSSLTLLGNKLDGTELSIDTGSGYVDVSESGIFQNEYVLSGTNISSLNLDGTEHNFTFYDGQNVYYLIKYLYNNQTFIIRG